MSDRLPDRPNEQWLGALRGDADPTALVELRRYLRRVLAKALSARRPDEETLDELTQDALVRILESLDSFRGDSRFSTWATTIASRTAFTALRRRAARERGRQDYEALERAVFDDRLEASVPATDETAARRQLLAALDESIRTALTPRQRIAIVAELKGHSSREVAERLGTNPNALYKLVHDARKKLRSALLAQGFTQDSLQVGLTAETLS